MTQRFREWTSLPDGLSCGPLNLISDVPGLSVGHHTVIEDEPRFLRTGVSVLKIDDVHERPVAAATHVFNGFGKSMGLLQIDELGIMESHVYLTNTLSVGAVQQGAVRLALEGRPETRTFNAVVMECSDGRLSDIRALAVTPEMAGLALADARQEFALGSVGAGTGMICFGFKGGIGSASRVVEIDGRSYTVGALVLSNFGAGQDLRLPGCNHAFTHGRSESGDGSLIMIAATDAPLMPHQLKRVARHLSGAIGLLGSPGSHGSGDFAVAFSTGLRLGSGNTWRNETILANDGAAMSALFRAATWAATEAIIDSMFTSPGMKGLLTEVASLRVKLPAP